MDIKALADRAVEAANAGEVLEVTPAEMSHIRDLFAQPDFEGRWLELVMPHLHPDKVGIPVAVKVIEPGVGEVTGTSLDMGRAPVQT